MTATITNSTGAPLVPGVKPKPSEVVQLAYDVLAEDGVFMSLNKIHKSLRRMWADDAYAERKRVRDEIRLIEEQGSLRHGRDRTYGNDPVGELATDLADYIKVRVTL